MKGLDFTDHTLTGATMKASGYLFCCRYLAGGTAAWKEMTKAEVIEKSAAGVLIVSNWETNGNPANTVAEGKAHANAALAQHLSLGGTSEDPIYFSIDTDCAIDAKDNYLAGLVSVLGGQRTGVYGSSGLVRHWLSREATFGWRSMSTGWIGGSSTAGMQLVQTGGGKVAGHSVDYDTSLADNFGGWNLNTHQNGSLVAISDTDLAAIANAVWTKNPGYGVNETPWGAVSDIRGRYDQLTNQVNGLATAPPLTPDQIAAAVVAALPTPSGGAGLTKADVAAAVKTLFAGAFK